MSTGVYRYSDLAALGIPYSREHIARLEREGKFPRHIKLNPGSGPKGSVGWVKSEIDAYFQDIIARRDIRTSTSGNDEALGAPLSALGARGR